MRYLLENLGFLSSSRDLASAAKDLKACTMNDTDVRTDENTMHGISAHLSDAVSPGLADGGGLAARQNRVIELDNNQQSRDPYTST